jgi:hypothetical protein
LFGLLIALMVSIKNVFTSLRRGVWFAFVEEIKCLRNRSDPTRQRIQSEPKAQAKPVTKTKAVATSKPVTPTVTRSRKARANITEGTRLYALAGRPTKAEFIKVYGAKGPAMTWEQRASAGVPAEKFQETLRAKLGNTKKLDSAVANS